MEQLRRGHTVQERGMVLMLMLALVASGVLLLHEARPPAAPVRTRPIVLENVTVHLPRFVPQGPVDVNRASQSELEALPGIGPVLAARIVAYREEHGAFPSLAELQKVSGIGPQTVQRLEGAAVTGSEDQ